MDVCGACGDECVGGFCDVCKVVVPAITGTGQIRHLDEEYVDRVRNSLGNPSTGIAQIWSRVRSLPGDEYDWAFDGGSDGGPNWISGPPKEWRLSDADLLTMRDLQRGRVPREGRDRHIFRDRVRDLQRGGVLPDGSYLSFADGKFFLDGTHMNIPYLDLSKMLEAGKNLEGVNWKRLLFSIDLAVTDFQPGPGSTNEGVVHPTILFLNRHHHGPRPGRWERGAARVSALDRTRWLRRWAHPEGGLLEQNDEVVRPDNPDLFREYEKREMVPRTLGIKNGKLQFRVRRDTGWRRIGLKRDPRIWARMATWVLSPPVHDDWKRALCLQQYLFSDKEMMLIEENDRRGIKLLKGVLEGNDRASADVEMMSLRVTGTSGLEYLVTPGAGGHHTRFVVRPNNSHPRGIEPGDLHVRWRHHHPDRHAICIVEKPALRRLVLGDSLASVMLALLDDLNSQRHIDTLQRHIERIARMGGDPIMRERDEEAELRQRLQNNRVHLRIRRATEVLPRLWSAMLRMPLGERVTFTAMRREAANVTFDGCDTQFRTEGMLDRRVIYLMLEGSGWIRDREEEELRGTTRVYMRTGTGHRDLGPVVEEIAEVLQEAVMVNGRIMLLPGPLWTYFERENPGIAPLLPGTEGEIA